MKPRDGVARGSSITRPRDWGLLLIVWREREVRTHSVLITPTEKVLRRLHHTFVPIRETRRDVFKQERIKSRLKCCAGSFFQKEKEKGFFLSIEISAIFFEMRADQGDRGEKVLQSKPSEAEYHARLLLKEQKMPFPV